MLPESRHARDDAVLGLQPLEGGDADGPAHVVVDRAVAGAVLDQDPYSGVSEWITPFEAEQRKASRALQAQQHAYTASDLAAFGDDYLLGLLDLPEARVSEQEIIFELRRRGYSDRQARILIEQERASRKKGVGGGIVE